MESEKGSKTFVRLPPNVEVTYVSQKIKKLRWIPDDSADKKYFITGVVDNEKHPFNVWSFKQYKGDEEGRNFDEFITFFIKGFITKFRFIDKNNIVLYMSCGDPRVIQLGDYEVGLYVANGLQNYDFTFEDEVATYGEDEWIHISTKPKRDANTTLETLCRVKSDEIIFGHIHGTMKVENICTTPDCRLNAIQVWNFQHYSSEFKYYFPQELSWYFTEGHVTEIKYTEKFTIAVSTTDGTVRLLKIKSDEKQAPLERLHVWEKLHSFSDGECSCTALDTMDGHIATVGQDGSLKVLSCESGEVTRNIARANLGALNSVCYIDRNEIMAGNGAGKMKVWDIRSPGSKPASTFKFTDTGAPTTCLARHPIQPRLVLAGDQTGAVGAWDLRAGPSPAVLLKAHSAAVSEMQFHPDNPNKLITVSRSGEMFDWNTGELKKGDTWPLLSDKDEVTVKEYLPASAGKPLNTFDCDGDRILCGGDLEALYDIKEFKYAD